MAPYGVLAGGQDLVVVLDDVVRRQPTVLDRQRHRAAGRVESHAQVPGGLDLGGQQVAGAAGVQVEVVGAGAVSYTHLDVYKRQVNKVTEGRTNIVDMLKNDEIVLVINTVEERRNAIADSRQIRTSALLARVTTFTTIAGAEAAVEGMRYMDQLDVISVQEMHAQLREA